MKKKIISERFFIILVSTTFLLMGFTHLKNQHFKKPSPEIQGHVPVKPTWKGAPDLYIKDQPTDAGLEPNPDPTPYYWISTDIWIRHFNDGGTDHQNPVYGRTNYVYVRVRNRGKLASAGISDNLKLYWAKASAGLGWPIPWNGSKSVCAKNHPVMGNIIGTQLIPSISPDGKKIMVFEWVPPDPSKYSDKCIDADASHFCLLVRIETSYAKPYGMTFPETGDLLENVKNNNNIAWKNVEIVLIAPDLYTHRIPVLISGSKFLKRSFAATNLKVATPGSQQANNILQAANIDIDLGIFTQSWLNAGGYVDSGYIHNDNTGKILIRLVSPNATIYGIPIDKDQVSSVSVLITPKTTSPNTTRFDLDLMQLDSTTIIGGERLAIRFQQQQFTDSQSASENNNINSSEQPQLKTYQSGKQLIVTMNDDKEYMVTVANDYGLVFTNVKMKNHASIPVTSYKTGIYFIKLTGIKDRRSYSAKVVIQ